MTSYHLVELLFDTAVKSIWLLGTVAILMLAWRGGAAATRHFAWLGATLSLLFLPLAPSVVPRWTGPAWARHAALVPGWMATRDANAPPDVSISGQANRVPSNERMIQLAGDRKLGEVAKDPVGFRGYVLWVWIAGVSATLLGCLVRFWLLRRMERNCRVLDDSRVQQIVRSAQAGLRLKRKVRLLQSEDRVMPMTWGWRRAAVLLPADAARWDDARLEMVLRHELAHVKRRDCLTQSLADVVCALYWFNPLAWLAARQMRGERERACDDLVLTTGARPSEYAGHLLEIARQFACSGPIAAIPIARPSGLERRLRAVVDARREHGRLRPAKAVFLIAGLAGLFCWVGGWKMAAADNAAATSREAEALRARQMAQIEAFSQAKERQSEALAAKAGERISPVFQRFFDAAIRGDGATVTNMYVDFKHHHPQYEGGGDVSLRTSYWSPVLEICLTYFDVVAGEPKYTQLFVDGVIDSIPPGSIYFGGTDPGRGLITAFCKSHAEANPFFTLTQNALADSTYLQYLQTMYGSKIYIPTTNDAQIRFEEYATDAQRRLEHDTQSPHEPRQIKPGENVEMKGGSIQVSGQVAVMAINGLLTKLIFDRNPGREFYIEQSFALDWMYPHLEPHGIIMKINREPLAEMTEDIVKGDQDYWAGIISGMVGDWLRADTPARTVADFVEQTYARKDLSSFRGDPRFIASDDAMRLFSKQRSSIAGLYAWRMKHPSGDSEKDRMAQAADLACRQAWVICPYSAEAVFGLVQFLLGEHRIDEALLVADTADRVSTQMGEQNTQISDLAKHLREQRK
jgi:beta-lactamase regulating signal transducer with metallopeptidase domain